MQGIGEGRKNRPFRPSTQRLAPRRDPKDAVPSNMRLGPPGVGSQRVRAGARPPGVAGSRSASAWRRHPSPEPGVRLLGNVLTVVLAAVFAEFVRRGAPVKGHAAEVYTTPARRGVGWTVT